MKKNESPLLLFIVFIPTIIGFIIAGNFYNISASLVFYYLIIVTIFTSLFILIFLFLRYLKYLNGNISKMLKIFYYLFFIISFIITIALSFNLNDVFSRWGGIGHLILLVILGINLIILNIILYKIKQKNELKTTNNK